MADMREMVVGAPALNKATICALEKALDEKLSYELSDIFLYDTEVHVKRQKHDNTKKTGPKKPGPGKPKPGKPKP